MTKKARIGDLVISSSFTAMRHVDLFTVSRYRQAMRMGAKFPDIIVDESDNVVVSGNHRLTAMLEEFGEDYVTTVDFRKFKTEADRIELFAQENIVNGRPLDRVSCKLIADALVLAGRSLEAVAALLNVPLKNLKAWPSGIVVQRGKKQVPITVKGGVVIPSGVVNEEQKDYIDKHDCGLKNAYLANQLATRLENGWVSGDDAEVAAFARLKALL